MSDAALEERIRSTGYTPKAKELDALFALLGGKDEDVAKDAERALARVGPPATRAGMARFSGSAPPERSRLCALVGRAAEHGDAAVVDWLILRLDDADGKTRRRAARALGKTKEARVESALVTAFREDAALPDARALVLALGNVGGRPALARLRDVRTTDPELGRVLSEARMKLERGLARTEAGSIDGSCVPARPLDVLLHVRAGLEEILADELGKEFTSEVRGRGRIQIALTKSLDSIFRARTFLHLGFPLPPADVGNGGPEAAFVVAMTSDLATEIFSTFTRGPIRYRIEWADAGKRRGATFRAAEAVARARPALVNDPKDALWEIVVTERPGKSGNRVYVEIWPRALPDPRFSYRKRTLPASSHPTIAAALARVAGVAANDVIWDPFVGAAGELVERALLGPYARLFGTDIDPEALSAARENLGAAKIERWELFAADARTFTPPEAPSLVLTNPPFGKRVSTGTEIGPVLDAVLGRVHRVLRPSGRMVWISPRAEGTAEAARRHGFSVRMRRAVDVGGVPAEIQVFSRAERGGTAS